METIFTKDKVADTEIEYIVASATHPVSYQVDGDLGSETIVITLIGVNGTDETDLYDDDEAIAVLSNVKPVCSFDRNIRIKLAKPITTNNVGLMKLK